MGATGPTETTAAAGGERSQWTQTAFTRLAHAGYRAGGARTAVVELLGTEGGCVEAEEVVARLRSRGRQAGTASVYRALAVLTELGLLHKVALPDSASRFELVLPGGEHHHHIVCDRCGRTESFSDEQLEAAVHAVSERASFEVAAHDITLHGTCEPCQRS